MKALKFICLAFLPVIFIISCSKSNDLTEGSWRGTVLLDTNDKSSELPFIFEVGENKDGDPRIIIFNAEEEIEVNEIEFEGDTVKIKMPVYKDEILARVVSNDSIAGRYLHVGSRSSYSMPFYAVSGKMERFKGANKPPALDVSGKWEVSAVYRDTIKNTYVAEFRQKGNTLTGTFMTAAGDYRYLEGAVSGNDLMLSVFEGYYTKLFRAKITPDGKITDGIIIGGPSSREKWSAVKNENAKLPDHDKLSSVREDIDKIDFTFPNLKNYMVSLSDQKYKGKPVIVSIGGSWCPNCKDEVRLLAELYEKYNPKGLEIICINFESNNLEESLQRIERFRSQLGAKFEFLYAGEAGRKVTEVLPFMKEFRGYPTTIFLNKNHKVLAVHTGFSGPGTGFHYDKLKQEIIGLIEKMVK